MSPNSRMTPPISSSATANSARCSFMPGIFATRWRTCKRATPTAMSAGRKRSATGSDGIRASPSSRSKSWCGCRSACSTALHAGFSFVEQSGEQYWLADLHRLSGQSALLQAQPDRARAEACFTKAIAVARSQEARLLELRAATDLARLWRGGRPNGDLRGLLEPILAGIEGGQTARDVRDARTLLA